jgi:hypothetical protein
LLKTGFPDVQWETQEVTISPDERVDTKRGSTLRFFQLVRSEITGSRCLSKLPGSTGAPSVDEILESLVVEVYMEFMQPSWTVVPARFFGPIV